MGPEEKKVFFETDVQMSQQTARSKSARGMMGLVVKYSRGYIKDENQANYVLIGFAVLAFITALFLFFGENL